MLPGAIPNPYGGVVPTLIAPRDDIRRSFAEAMDEFRAEGRGSDDDRSAFGNYLRTRAAEWSGDEAFSHFTASIRADELEETPRPEGFVPATEMWWVDGETFLGRITIRHRLTPHLLEVGGHIGYDALKGEYGDLFKKGIVDAAKVTRSALQNAASIAAMVLTTETLITDMPEKEKAGAGGGHDHGGGMDF